MDISTTLVYCLTMNTYRPRTIDAELSRALQASGAVVINGARATGKTESARQLAASELRLDSGDPRAVLAREQPSSALPGATPRLLDEWQLSPGLWNETRRAVDDRRTPGQFILTGSAAPDDDPLRHSGAGRFRQVLMRTMSFFETGHSTGAVSLRKLFEQTSGDDNFPGNFSESAIDFHEVITRIVTGGWPGWFEMEEHDARSQIRSYIDDIVQYDFPSVAGPRRDPRRFAAFLGAYAGLVSQPASFAAIARRMEESASVSSGGLGAAQLHDLAVRVHLIEDQPAWAPKLRSRTPSIQTPARHLLDPSLAASLLSASSDRLLSEPETLGFLFESQVVHDLRVYAQSIHARGVFHYRDMKARDEFDAIVEADDGTWLGIEVKLGEASVDAAAANLLRVAAKVVRAPTALIVITPTGIAHRRKDGVFVIPLTVLGP